MAVIILNQSSYTDGAALTNVADEIGLSISQAQAYGIAVKEHTTGTSNFSEPYGLSISLLSGGSNTAYLLFADLDGDQQYDGDWGCATGVGYECLEKKLITRGNYVYELCVVRTSGSDQCDNIGRVDVSFKRPRTEALIAFYNSSGNLYVPPNLKGVRITLRSQSGKSRSVVVYTSGQVSIQ